MEELKHWTEYLTEEERTELTRAEMYLVEMRTYLHEACIERRKRERSILYRKKVVERKIRELQKKLNDLVFNNGEA